jgi:CMP-N-acetylneuraminic acid synthetase
MEAVAPNALAIVPARGGSKGIPGKNLQRVGENTLIGHACQIADRCPSVSWVVISSDDAEMGQEGTRNGADLFVHRPAELATDKSPAADTWRHAWIEAERHFDQVFEVSVWLQPTSPTRTVEDVENTIARLLISGASAAVTVSPVPKHFAPQKQLQLTDRGTVSPIISGSVPNVRRQDVPDSYWLNGLCYAARREPFLRDGVVLPEDAVPIIIRRPVANIDELEDLEAAERLLTL